MRDNRTDKANSPLSRILEMTVKDVGDGRRYEKEWYSGYVRLLRKQEVFFYPKYLTKLILY